MTSTNDAVVNRHQLKLKDIAQQHAAQNGSSTTNTSSSASSGNGSGAPGGGGSNGGAALAPIHINIIGQPQNDPGTLYGTRPVADMLAEIIASKGNSI